MLCRISRRGPAEIAISTPEIAISTPEIAIPTPEIAISTPEIVISSARSRARSPLAAFARRRATERDVSETPSPATKVFVTSAKLRSVAH
eukprot:347138-Pleurochrysis_carterae.AAC.3